MPDPPDPSPAKPFRRAATFLGRIAQALREQNWVAVCIEVGIVVLGVVVGFQVTAWGQARQAAAEEERALRRLAVEAEAVVGYLGRSLELRADLIGRLEIDLAALLDDTVTDFPDSTGGAYLLQAFRYPAATPPRSVYDELTGSGRFGDLSSPEVRHAVASYYAELDFLETQLPFFRQGVGPIHEILGDGARFAYDPDRPVRVRMELDLAELRADSVLHKALLTGLRNQIVFQTYRRAAYEAAVEMCDRLAEAVGETCDVEG